MEPETKMIQRDSLRDLIDASREKPQVHAHVIDRSLPPRARTLGREPSALRGLIIVVAAVLVVRWLILLVV